MVSFITKLKSLKPTRPSQQPPSEPEHPKSRKQSTTLPLPPHHHHNPFRTSISPKLRTFFEPQTPKTAAAAARAANLGVLDSPSSPESPESAYSGVALLGNVEIVRRVSKGKVKRIELSRVVAYEAADAGTQTGGGADAKSLQLELGVGKRRSGLAMGGWEMLYCRGAGLLFMGGCNDDGDGRREKDAALQAGLGIEDAASLPLTGNLLRKLQAAIAVDAELQGLQKRTAREVAALHALQESLRKRKDLLKDRQEEFRGNEADAAFDLAEKSAVDRELVRVWEAQIETMDERLRGEERLERKRDEFEGVARAALAVLALGLAERCLVDVVEEVRGDGGEWEFEGRYRF